MKRFADFFKFTFALVACLLLCAANPSPKQAPASSVAAVSSTSGIVATMQMKMLILPGTATFLEESIAQAAKDGAKVIIVTIDTPGGILDTTKDMVQKIFDAPIPVVFYVAPTGASATSAGVFLTLAGHIASMAPGTSMGSAHPVAQDGKDIEGDMRAKAENAAIAMVKAIAEQRARNIGWAEKAVKESSSITEKEALSSGVVDLVAADIPELLRQLKGKKVKVRNQEVILDDYSALPIMDYEISTRDKMLNIISHPNVAALLWVLATTGISIELYSPGLILPGVVGVISLLLALTVNQVIPLNYGALSLLVVGALMIGADMFIGSLILGLGGIVSLVIGAAYLIDTGAAPGLAVSLSFIAPLAIFLGGIMMMLGFTVWRSMRSKVTSGLDGLIGEHGKALETIAASGTVSVRGEIWKASATQGVIQKDTLIEVTGVKEGLVLEVKGRG